MFVHGWATGWCRVPLACAIRSFGEQWTLCAHARGRGRQVTTGMVNVALMTSDDSDGDDIKTLRFIQAALYNRHTRHVCLAFRRIPNAKQTWRWNGKQYSARIIKLMINHHSLQLFHREHCAFLFILFFYPWRKPSGIRR